MTTIFLRKGVAAVLTSVVLFSSCMQSTPTNTSPKEMWTKEGITEFLSESAPTEIQNTGVYAFGTFQGFDEKTRAYTKARSEKILEIETIITQFMNATEKVHNTVHMLTVQSMQVYVYGLLAFPQDQETLFQNLRTQMMQGLLEQVLYAQLRTQYNSWKETSDPIEKAQLVLHMRYLQMQYAHSATQNIQKHFSDAKTLLVLLQDRQTTLEKIIVQFIEASMQKTTQDLGEYVFVMHAQLGLIAYAEHVLGTADFLYAQEIYETLPGQIKQLEEKIAANTWSSFVTPEDQSLLRVLLQEMKERQEVLGVYINTFDTTRLLTEPKHLAMQDRTVLPIVHAGIKDSLYWLGGKISNAASTTADYAKAGAALTWDATKNLAIAGKDLAVATAKTGGKIVGAGLDVVDATVKSTFDTAVNVAYFEKPSVIFGQVKDNFTQSYARIMDGKGGAPIFSQAKAYMEGAEEGAQRLAEKVVELTPVGKGVTSTTIGFIAKTTAGFFTGVAKDSYDVLNPASSEEDTLMGMFGLALTAVGGTTTAVKPSDVIKGAGNTTKDLLLGGYKTVTTLEKGSFLTTARNILTMDVKEACTKIFSRKAIDGGKKLVEESLEKTIKAGKSSFDDGLNVLKEKMTKDIPEKFTGLFEKKSFGALLDDVFGTTGDTPKEWIKGYLENVVASSADDLLKNMVKKGTSALFVEDVQEQKKTTGEVLRDFISAHPAIFTAMTEDEKKEIEYTFGPILPDSATRMPKYEGTYTPSFSIDLTVSGIHSSGRGTVTITVGNETVSCNLNATQTASGKVQGITINASSQASSSSCTGTVSAQGDVVATGVATGLSTTTVMGQSTQNKAGSSFEIRGKIQEGKFVGTLTVGAYTMDLR